MPWTACPREQYRALPDLQDRISNSDPDSYYAAYKTWQDRQRPTDPDDIRLFFTTGELRQAIDAGCSPNEEGRVLEDDYETLAHFAGIDPPPIEDLLGDFFGDTAKDPARYKDDRLKKLNGVVVLHNDGKIYVIRPHLLNRNVYEENDPHWGPVLQELQQAAALTGERIFNIDLAAQFRMGGDDGFFGRKPSAPGVIVRGGA